MSGDQIKSISDKLGKLEDKVDVNTKITQEGFDRMNGRVRDLELKQARREGRESVVRGDMDWKKVALALLGILTTAATIALGITQAVIK